MIADFYKTFKNKKKGKAYPASVLSEIESQLPKGYQVKKNRNGGYSVLPSSFLTNQKLKIDIDREKNHIPKDIPINKIPEYAYRTQKTLKCDNFRIIEDEKEYSLDDYNEDIITGKKNGMLTKIEMHPAPFPPPLSLKLGYGDGEEVSIEFQRVPYESMDSVMLKNTTFPVLSISFIARDQGQNRGEGFANISVEREKASTIDEVLCGYKILNSFLNGTLTIDGKILCASSDDKCIDGDIIGAIKTWESLKKLQDILDVSFTPSADFPDEDMEFLRELIRFFLEDKEIVYPNPFSHFHLETDDIDRLREKVGVGSLPLIFFEEGSGTLLGADFPLYQVNILFDFSISDISVDDDGEGAEIYISDFGGQGIKLVKKYYRSEQDAKEGANRLLEKYMNSSVLQ